MDHVGKAARLKRERKAPPTVGKRKSGAVDPKLVWLATIGVVVLIGIVAGALLATRTKNAVPPPAPASASDRNAPASLVAAADKVGFRPTTEPGVGQIEDEPASAAKPPANPDLLPVGSQAPAFTLKTPEGDSVSLADFRSKAVLLELFATWCPHCNAEAPHLQALYRSLPRSKYAFVSVNGDGEGAASVYAYHRYFGLSFPALLDPGGQPGSFHQAGSAGQVSTKYRLAYFPTFYVIDPHGRITWRSDGEQPDALLRDELARAAARG
jgi:peroxiredoxin